VALNTFFFVGPPAATDSSPRLYGGASFSPWFFFACFGTRLLRFRFRWTGSLFQPPSLDLKFADLSLFELFLLFASGSGARWSSWRFVHTLFFFFFVLCLLPPLSFHRAFLWWRVPSLPIIQQQLHGALWFFPLCQVPPISADAFLNSLFNDLFFSRSLTKSFSGEGRLPPASTFFFRLILGFNTLCFLCPPVALSPPPPTPPLPCVWTKMRSRPMTPQSLFFRLSLWLMYSRHPPYSLLRRVAVFFFLFAHTMVSKATPFFAAIMSFFHAHSSAPLSVPQRPFCEQFPLLFSILPCHPAHPRLSWSNSPRLALLAFCACFSIVTLAVLGGDFFLPPSLFFRSFCFHPSTLFRSLVGGPA